MTNPINYQTQSPAYSGVTINISHPTVNANPATVPMYNPAYCQQNGYCIPINQNNNCEPSQYGITPAYEQNAYNAPNQNPNISYQNPTPNQIEYSGQSYPPQYYLNNYNYVNGNDKGSAQTATQNSIPENLTTPYSPAIVQAEEDLSKSENIISELDARNAEQKELEKNGIKSNITALTNEYIMSLENYLNNPNSEIRLMASKEVLTRLDEDKSRFDDAALNALLNKMLQDPDKIVRIAALSAFSSGLASGNDYTVELLNKIQNDPNADQEDVIQVADILLKMSSTQEVKYTPGQIQPQIDEIEQNNAA